MANYKIIDDNPKYLLIEDVGPWDAYRSVTNDADSVVWELRGGLNQRPLYYVDTLGSISRLDYDKDYKFLDFKSECPPGYDRDYRKPVDYPKLKAARAKTKDDKWNEVEEELMNLSASNRKRLSEIGDAIDVHHGGKLGVATMLLEDQRKLHRALSSYLTTGDF